MMKTETNNSAARDAGQIEARLAPVGATVEQDGIRYRVELREGSGHTGGRGSFKWLAKIGGDGNMDDFKANRSLVTVLE